MIILIPLETAIIYHYVKTGSVMLPNMLINYTQRSIGVERERGGGGGGGQVVGGGGGAAPQ